MRENRTYGSEGGETGKPVFPTPIKLAVAAVREITQIAIQMLYFQYLTQGNHLTDWPVAW